MAIQIIGSKNRQLHICFAQVILEAQKNLETDSCVNLKFLHFNNFKEFPYEILIIILKLNNISQLYKQLMLPPIKYKIHSKLAQIQQQKRKRRQILQEARQKQTQQLQVLKHDRQEYMQQNKEIIQTKQQDIYQRKLEKRNRIREQDVTRAERIANKKSQILMKLIPERRQLIQSIRREYIEAMEKQDQRRKQQIQKYIEQKLDAESQKFRETFSISKDRIKQNNIIDTNDGICVICLNEQAEIYMVVCKHLVCCKDCQFMIRMNKKCPLCRASSKYENIRDINRKKKKEQKEESKRINKKL